MRNLIIPLALGLGLFNFTCGGAKPAGGGNQNSVAANNSRGAARADNASSPELGVSSSHGGGAKSAAPAAPQAAGGDADRSLVNTAEYDARIQKAAAKADAPGASASDKKAAAEAYLARGNIYRDAGNPKLYKYALGDYRRVLRYQPDNAEAKEKAEEIVSIYESLGRPVPTNGLEP